MLSEPTQRHRFVVVPDDNLASPFGANGETQASDTAFDRRAEIWIEK